MNKVVILTLALIVGILSSIIMCAERRSLHSVETQKEADYLALSNALATLEGERSQMEASLRTKNTELSRLTHSKSMNPDALALLSEATTPKRSPAKQQHTARTLSELRQELGIGWNASADYVLVNKTILAGLNFRRVEWRAGLNEITKDVLSLTPEEQEAVTSAVRSARDTAVRVPLTREEPGGDIVAKYTASAPSPEMNLSLSNQFATEIIAALGSERAALIAPHGWNELRSELYPFQHETLTVRKTSNPEPDIVWEITRNGQQVSTGKVRYAQYLTHWFNSLLTNGWQSLADTEGFKLPPKFRTETH
jgi:hypothetical protein